MKKIVVLLMFFIVVGATFEIGAQRRKATKPVIKIEDKFETIDTTLRWVTTRRVQDDMENRYLYGCHENKFQIKMPVAITGLEKNMELVIQILTEKLIGQATSTFEDAIKIVEANFTRDVDGIPYKRDDQELEDYMISPMNSGWTEYKIWPCCSSSKLVGFVIYSQEGGYVGKQNVSRSDFVTFIRNASGMEILCSNIYNTSAPNAKILRLINHEISVMNQKGDGSYNQATYISNNIRIEKTGISYIYANNEIAPDVTDDVVVTIDYAKLRPYLRPAFYKLITTSTDWVDFENPFVSGE